MNEVNEVILNWSWDEKLKKDFFLFSHHHQQMCCCAAVNKSQIICPQTSCTRDPFALRSIDANHVATPAE